MRDHIAAHLESIALLFLPDPNDLDNAASIEVQSESARSSSHTDSSQKGSLYDDSDEWDRFNKNTQIQGAENAEINRSNEQHLVTPTAIDHWNSLTSVIRSRITVLDPSQDRTLMPFVTRAVEAQTLDYHR